MKKTEEATIKQYRLIVMGPVALVQSKKDIAGEALESVSLFRSWKALFNIFFSMKSH